MQNAAKQIVLCERTAQKLSFEWSDYCRRNSICQGCQHPKGILYYIEDNYCLGNLSFWGILFDIILCY